MVTTTKVFFILRVKRKCIFTRRESFQITFILTLLSYFFCWGKHNLKLMFIFKYHVSHPKITNAGSWGSLHDKRIICVLKLKPGNTLGKQVELKFPSVVLLLLMIIFFGRHSILFFSKGVWAYFPIVRCLPFQTCSRVWGRFPE